MFRVALYAVRGVLHMSLKEEGELQRKSYSIKITFFEAIKDYEGLINLI